MKIVGRSMTEEEKREIIEVSPIPFDPKEMEEFIQKGYEVIEENKLLDKE